VDTTISDLPSWLKPNDLLTLNNTKVLSAKITVRRRSGGLLGGLFLEEPTPNHWRVMLRGARRVKPGETLTLLDRDGNDAATFKAESSLGDGEWMLVLQEIPRERREKSSQADGEDGGQVGCQDGGQEPNESTESILDRAGFTPLPPYIRRDDPSTHQDDEDRKRYQTIFAEQPGAVAAPTAGLHLTEDLLKTLHRGGIESAFVTLHVGIGTFRPIKASGTFSPQKPPWLSRSVAIKAGAS
jgi:S-adenosylmethionine:tRNA ribosyltransferase-isomerase